MNMKISTFGVIAYLATFIPKRCRNARERWVTEQVSGTVDFVRFEEAPVAFRVTEELCSFEVNKVPVRELRLYKGRLFGRIRRREECGKPPYEPTLVNFENPSEKDLEDARLLYGRVSLGAQWYHNEPRRSSIEARSWLKDGRDEALVQFESFCADRFVMEDGTVWGVEGEPRYVVQTFGLGHNHGGTAIFLDQHYNGNLAAKCYFRADQRESAIAEAERIAARRGDTKSIPMRSPGNIEILIPEAVRLNPSKEHGDGDPFLNQLYAATESAESVAEAGILGLAVLAQNLHSR